MDTIHCYFVHRHLNNAWYNKAHSLIGKPHSVIIELKQSSREINDQLGLSESSTPYNPVLVTRHEPPYDSISVILAIFFNQYRFTVHLLYESLSSSLSFMVKGPWKFSRVVADQFVSLH